jgi:hypothetical protein
MDNDKHAPDPAAALEARRDYRALRKSIWQGRASMIDCPSGSDLDPACAQSTVVGSVRA